MSRCIVLLLPCNNACHVIFQRLSILDRVGLIEPAKLKLLKMRADNIKFSVVLTIPNTFTLNQLAALLFLYIKNCTNKIS